MLKTFNCIINISDSLKKASFDMGQKLSTPLRRHRRKFYFLGGAIGSAAFLNYYMRRKLTEWESQKTIELMDRLKRQNQFEATLATCDQDLLNFMPTIRKIILENVNVEPIVEELKNKAPNKKELWDELKILVFTQIISEMYAQCLLILLLRVELCILSGHMYVHSRKNKSDISSTTSDNPQNCLSHVSNFLNGGVKDMIIPVEDAVRKSFRGIKLSDSLKIADFHNIFRRITEHMSQGSCGVAANVIQYVTFFDQKENQNEETYDTCQMVAEAEDLLECDDFNKVFFCFIEHGIAMLMDRISECYMHLGNCLSDFSNPNNYSVPLAKLIPIIHTVFGSHKPNDKDSLVHILLQQESLQSFTANIFESFSQYNT